MAQVDSILDNNNRLEEETIKEASSEAHLYEKNPITFKTKQINTTADLARLSTEVTPMYIKNPMYAKNRLSAAIESVSATTNLNNTTKDDRSFLIEPSPSGVTRIKINSFDLNNNQVSQVSNVNSIYNPMNTSYKPVTVQFNTNPHYPMQFSTFQPDLSQRPSGIITNAQHYQYNHYNNKTDSCTSPIKTLNANYEESQQVQKDTFTQKEQTESLRAKKDVFTDAVITLDEPPRTGMFVKNRDLKSGLEKSKLIVVNVTPKTSKKEFEELSIPTSPKSKQQTFELDMETDVVVKTNEPHLNESVAEIPLQAPGSNPNFHHLQQSNQTPILTSLLKQQKMQIIDRPKSDPNEILNLESNCYYDNIIKLKQINDHQQVVYRNESANPNNAFETEQLQQQEQPQQPEFNYNKLIEKLNETNKNISINQRDQCLQFPTPGGLNDESNKKLPRTAYTKMNTESKTGFFNLESNYDENKYDNESSNTKPNIETFYDGTKVWTAMTNMIKDSGEEDNGDDQDEIYTTVNKKKNVQVKIKLPNETVSDIDEPLRIKEKKRNGQGCCFFLLILILLLIALGIVLYFLGKKI